MNTLFPDYLSPTPIHNFEFNYGSAPANQNPESNLLPPLPSSFSEAPPNPAQSGDDLPDSNPYANLLLRYINDKLMEEDMEGTNCVLQDRLALQAAENSFYQALIDEFPPGEHCTPGVRQNARENPNVNFPEKYCTPGVCENARENPHVSFFNNRSVNSFEKTSLVSDSGCNSFPNLFGAQENNLTRGRKNYELDVGDYVEEGRRKKKQPAVCLDESELSGMFDDILLNNVDGVSQTKKSTRSKKNTKKVEVVDLWTLLSKCAKAVYISDHKTATELLQEITQHSSDSGDALQRLAHYFAIGLELRLAGKDSCPVNIPWTNTENSTADYLKSYKMYISACPFRKMSKFFANRSILDVAENATTLHIIDFGIQYGFQWPSLIQRLSERPGGPPKLRITGIEFPQPGFRPTKMVEETGHRIRRFCENFNVPFEFNVVAKKWETIQLQELNLHYDEVIVVNCLYRSRHIPGDAEEPNSARDTVLKLIHDIKPGLFIHGIINGSFNNPFFLTRFKEVLYHYSALFDMFDTTSSREDEPRKLFEKELFGKDIVNVVACEGAERMERPETYKQWQGRNQRAGLKQVGLDLELVKLVKTMVKKSYHKNFTVDVDGNWMLQGWKGRVIFALSCWKPAQ